MTSTAPSRFRFTRLMRLTTKAGFSAVFQERSKISQGRFQALYIRNQQAYPRLGLVISKRVIRKATSRNYLKRIIREGFRHNQYELAGLDIVVMVKAGFTLEDKPKLHKELENLWQRLIAYCRPRSSSSSGDTDTA